MKNGARNSSIVPMASVPIIIIIFFAIFKSGYSAVSIDDIQSTTGIIFFRNATDFIETNVMVVLDVLKIPEFDMNKTIVLYVPGYYELALTSITTNDVINAYLDLPDHHILLLNYTDVTMRDYPTSVFSVDNVGKVVAQALNTLFANGISRETFYGVGHSLGAHVLGSIGNHMDPQLNLLVGLDPARPMFYFHQPYLGNTNAKFAICLHSDAGSYGTENNVCNLDIIFNGGKKFQPGCPSVYGPPLSLADLCSHQRSNHFWANIIRYPELFRAVPCVNSISLFPMKTCNSNSSVVITPQLRNRGTYYLNTSNRAPYGLGMQGINGI